MSSTERFWSKVDVAGVCWEWTASVSAGGYGRFGDGSTRAGYVGAHRWAWEHLVGPIPAGLELDHLCRNPACVNPDHLEPVTRAVNNLRSNSCTARKARQTHCGEGHEFTPENTDRDRLGRRTCVTCKQAYERTRRPQRAAYMAARRAKARAAA